MSAEVACLRPASCFHYVGCNVDGYMARGVVLEDDLEDERTVRGFCACVFACMRACTGKRGWRPSLALQGRPLLGHVCSTQLATYPACIEGRYVVVLLGYLCFKVP